MFQLKDMPISILKTENYSGDKKHWKLHEMFSLIHFNRIICPYKQGYYASVSLLQAVTMPNETMKAHIVLSFKIWDMCLLHNDK